MGRVLNIVRTKRLAVIGNGMATCRLLDELIRRAALDRYDVTVFGDEKGGAYNRILLSRVLAGQRPDDIVTKPYSWYERSNVRLIDGTTVSRIDPPRKALETSDGREFRYDIAVIATGSRPQVPPIHGMTTAEGELRDGVFVYRAMDDCLRMRRFAQAGDNAVVLGGGLLGLEAAKVLCDRGLHVTVVHAAETILNAQLDALGGEMLRLQIEQFGIFVRTGRTVDAIVGQGRVEGVVLDDGKALPADMVVLACGVRPRVELASAAGLPVNRGILVNDTLATEEPGIYALGECAEHAGKTYGIVNPVWEQAAVLADVLSGTTPGSRYRGSKQFSRLKVAGVDVASMGLLQPELESDGVVQIIEERRKAYRKLILRDGRSDRGNARRGYERCRDARPDFRPRRSAAGQSFGGALCRTIPRRAGVARSHRVHLSQGQRLDDRGGRLERSELGRGRRQRHAGGHRLRLVPKRDSAARRASGRATRGCLDSGGADRMTAMDRRTVLVVGNGMVSHRFCQEMAEHDPERRYRLVVVGEESRPAYDRVHLTSYFTQRSADALLLGTHAWYEEQGVELHVGTRIVRVDRTRREATTDRGELLAYDLLVFATGSAPFVPPVPGVDKPGVFVYRTLDDLDAIMLRASGARRAAVIGGGLLGLEAARAVLDAGLPTHVVEVAPRLMPRQLDGVASALLERTIRELGVEVHLDKRIVRLTGEASVTGIEFSDGEQLEADLVIISAGIRPRDELAREAGIEIGQRGGVVVDDCLRTSDDRVFAIGEVALHRGVIHGLVAPGYEMANVLARHLAGKEAAFDGADSSAKLKLLGTDVATFGEPFQDFGTVPDHLP